MALLFQALMLQSGNDAANALARAAGGVAATVEAMNETAEEIGAYDTVAGTPSGSGRRRAVLLALRPGADLPRAARRPGDGRRS